MQIIKLALTFATTLVALLSCSENTRESDEPRPPNVVLIFIDDEGYGDVGCYGATGFETPNIDRLASEGMMFTNFYAAQPVCSVSRAGLLTGCYPNRLGFPGALFPYDTIGLNSEEFTMAEIRYDAPTWFIFGNSNSSPNSITPLSLLSWKMRS